MIRYCKFHHFLLTAALMLLLFPIKAGATDKPQQNIQPSEVQNAIDILEDDQRRQEIISLLKLLSSVEPEKTAASASAMADSEKKENIETQKTAKSFFSGLVKKAWLNISLSKSGVKQSWSEIKTVAKAISAPKAMAMWVPYLLKIFIWCFICLLATHIIAKKYGKLSNYCFSGGYRYSFKAALKYLLVIAGPSLVLITTLLAIPELSTTEEGVTADMANGFSFSHSIIRHLFINLSILYVFLEVANALFTSRKGERSIIRIHPILSKHFMHTLRTFAIYLATLSFFKGTIMDHFVVNPFYSVLLVGLSLPAPIYLTCRLKKLRRLMRNLKTNTATNEDINKATAAQGRPVIKYQVNKVIKKNLFVLALLGIWGVWPLFLLNPMGTSERFIWSLNVSLTILALAVVVIMVQRRLMLQTASPDTEHGMRLLLYVDLMSNIIVAIGLIFAILAIWGLPLSSLMESIVFREILSNVLIIAVVIAALIVFVKFSRGVTEWLLSSPDMHLNRNWLTITPLILGTIRSLAIFLGVVIVLELLGVSVGPILAGAGILGLGIGMGAQSLVKDIINGISILLMDTLAVGDYVSIGGKSGTVESVGLRSIRLRDPAGNLATILNSTVDTIVNMTRDYSKEVIEFAVPYDADPDQMLNMAHEVAETMSQDSKWKPYLIGPITVPGIVSFDAEATTIRIIVQTTAGDQWLVGRELRLRLKRRMLSEGLNSVWFSNKILYPADISEDLEKYKTEMNLATQTDEDQ